MSYQEEGERIARQLGNGVIYNGPQMDNDKFIGHTFADVAATRTTFVCLGLEECKANLTQKRKDFGAAPPTFGSATGRPAEDTVGARVLKTLVSQTINDITMDQMNRIIRRLNRMPQTERGVPKRVADVLADEIGPQKALQYIDKALAAGQIKVREYDEMRAVLLLPLPREEIPRPTIRRMAAELFEGQQRVREDFRKLTGQGQQALQKPFKAVDEDVKRMRKALGL